MKLTRRAVLQLAAAATAGVTLCAQSTPSSVLLILAKADQMMAIVDPASLKIVGRVPTGPDPHEVVTSADGTVAYVSNYGGGAYNTITPIDLVGQKALPAIDLGALRGPHGLDFAGGKVWFTAEAAKAIGSYDPAAKAIDLILGTGQNRTHMIAVSPDLQRVVTSNVNSATVSIIERTAGRGRGPAPAQPGRGPAAPAQTDWDETVVAVGRGVEGFDVAPGGKEIWTGNAQDGTISIVDLASKQVSQTLQANVMRANRLKFTRDGKLVFVSMLGSPEVAVFDAASRKELKRVKVGTGAAGILMQPDGARAFVACSPDNYVVVIDLKTLEVTGKIEAGRNPDGLAWAARK